MEDTLLINLDDILHYTTISGNVDEALVNPHILNAQVLYIEPILGSKLFDKIVDLYDSKDLYTTGYTEYNTLLSKYITPSLVMHTMEIYIPLNAFQMTDGGVYRLQPNNANYSPIEDVEKTASRYRIMASKYDAKLFSYLTKYVELYPEYQNEDGLIKKTEITQKSGIYLGTNNINSKIRI